jgi:hypothetical protein
MFRRDHAVPLALSLLLWAGAARGQGADTDQGRAAAAFDEGVRLYRDADFGGAARAFLRADAAAANAEAARNAVVAARRAADDRLLAEAATRAIERGAADASLARVGREALAEAAAKLARLELACSAPGCAIEIDGEPVATPTAYALPGTHRLTATSPERLRAEQVVSVRAGLSYRFHFDPALPVAPAAPRATRPPAAAPESPGGLSPVVFFVGLGVTSMLAGLTVWSGVDAIAARDNLPNPPTTPERDDVLARARRTDVLLGGAVATGAVTAALAIWFVRWRADPPRARAPRGSAPRFGTGVVF